MISSRAPLTRVPGLRPSGLTKARSSEEYLTVHSDCLNQGMFSQILEVRTALFALIPPPTKKRKVKDDAGFRKPWMSQRMLHPPMLR